MKYGFFGLIIIMTGLLGILFIGLFQSITVNNESEYYVIKEAMEASMLEAVDIACYRDADKNKGCGERIKISEQKFVENFSRRFAGNISGDVNSFELDFYDIIESPSKASVVIKGLTKEYGIMVTENSDGTFDITNHLSGILEYDPLITSGSGSSLNSGGDPNSDLASIDIELKFKEEGSENFTGGNVGNNNEVCDDCGDDFDANNKTSTDGHVGSYAGVEEPIDEDDETPSDGDGSNDNNYDFSWGFGQ